MNPTDTRKTKAVNNNEGDSTAADKDVNCSYTAMIAQAIMRTPYKRATLSEIYNFMAASFEILKKRGNGWRNCVRHTLSLNECFVKLNRPENGRSCNWTVHPSYFEAFMRGDYRKRRTNRKKTRSIPQWTLHDERYMGLQPPNPSDLLPYLPPSNTPILPPYHHTGPTNLRTNEVVERISQQTQPPTAAPASHHSMWHSYVSTLNDSPPSKMSSAHDSSVAFAHYHHSMYMSEQQKHSATNIQHHFQLPEYTNESSPNEFNEHLSPNTSLDTSAAHAERYTRFDRQYANQSFHSSYSKVNPPASERASYEMNCGGERSSYERSSSYGVNGPISAQPFQMENLSGSLTNRPYRTQYF